jgi:hypothetical protein
MCWALLFWVRKTPNAQHPTLHVSGNIFWSRPVNEATGDIFHLLWRHLSVVSGLARPVNLPSNAVAECSLYYRECSTSGRYRILVVAGGRTRKILVLDSALCAGVRRCNSDLSGASNMLKAAKLRDGQGYPSVKTVR